MNKHTEGPWHWVDGQTDQPYQWGEINEGYPSLRTVKEYGKNETVIKDGQSYTSWALPVFVCNAEHVNSEADAHLIASAPELLEALENFLYEYLRSANSGDWGNWDVNADPTVIKARAAIAKAKGEQQ